MMIENGPEACFLKDNNGYLPAHIACMRHCSPEKLRMLLAVNPAALFARTDNNDTLLELANKKATKAHPNYALIDELQKQLAGDVSHYDPVVFTTPLPQPSTSRPQIRHNNDHIETGPSVVSLTPHQSYSRQYSSVYASSTHTPTSTRQEVQYHYPHTQQPFQSQYHHHHHHQQPRSPGPYPLYRSPYELYAHNSIVGRVSSEDEDADVWNRNRLDSGETWASPTRQRQSQPSQYQHIYSYHQDEDHRGSVMRLDSRFGDVDSFNSSGASTRRYTRVDSVHDHSPTERKYPSNPKNGYHISMSPTMMQQHKPKSSSVIALAKGEEPAANLLLHFSKNLSSSVDGDTAKNNSHPAHRTRKSTEESSPGLDLASVSGRFAEV
jgi:Ankyrin repeats (many copies)